MVKKAMLSLGVLLFVVASAYADQTVLCATCKGPSESSKCEFNGKTGSWGTPVTVNGVTYQVCVIPSVTVIRPEDAILTREQLQMHSMRLGRGVNPRDLRFQPPPANQYRQVDPQQLLPAAPPKEH